MNYRSYINLFFLPPLLCMWTMTKSGNCFSAMAALFISQGTRPQTPWTLWQTGPRTGSVGMKSTPIIFLSMCSILFQGLKPISELNSME